MKFLKKTRNEELDPAGMQQKAGAPDGHREATMCRKMSRHTDKIKK